MTVSLGQNGDIAITGNVTLEDAEPLLRLLIDDPEAGIAWKDCSTCHSAVLQILLAADRTIIDQSTANFLGRWVAVSLKAKQSQPPT